MRKENGCSLILVYINIISILFFYFLFVGISLLQKKGEKKERIYIYIKKKETILKGINYSLFIKGGDYKMCGEDWF